MVGAVRFELTTSCTRNTRATKLRYAPNQDGETASPQTELQRRFFSLDWRIAIPRRSWLSGRCDGHTSKRMGSSGGRDLGVDCKQGDLDRKPNAPEDRYGSVHCLRRFEHNLGGLERNPPPNPGTTRNRRASARPRKRGGKTLSVAEIRKRTGPLRQGTVFSCCAIEGPFLQRRVCNMLDSILRRSHCVPGRIARWFGG